MPNHSQAAKPTPGKANDKQEVANLIDTVLVNTGKETVEVSGEFFAKLEKARLRLERKKRQSAAERAS